MPISIYRSVTVTPTLQIIGAYSAGDVVGGLLTFDFKNLPTGGGILGNIYITDDDNEKAAATLYVYTSAPTTIADDAAFAAALAIADLKAQKYVKTILATDYVSLGPGAYWSDIKINQILAFERYLYAYFVCTATPTYTAVGDLAFTISILLEG